MRQHNQFGRCEVVRSTLIFAVRWRVLVSLLSSAVNTLSVIDTVLMSVLGSTEDCFSGILEDLRDTNKVYRNVSGPLQEVSECFMGFEKRMKGKN